MDNFAVTAIHSKRYCLYVLMDKILIYQNFGFYSLNEAKGPIFAAPLVYFKRYENYG